MADSTHDPENDSSEETQAPPPARRRRRAGAPAGAPAFTPPSVPEPESTAPRTVVAAQDEGPAEPATTTSTRRRRRRAGAPAGAPVIPAPESGAEETTAEEAPAEEVGTEQPSADDADTAAEPTAEEDTTDEDTAEEGAEDNPVVGDLRALASSRGASGERERGSASAAGSGTATGSGSAAGSGPDAGPGSDAGSGSDADADDDRARRREQVQMDFASLLFQAPTPQPRTTVGPQDAPAGSAEISFEGVEEERDRREEDSEGEDESTQGSRRSRSRSRRSSQRDAGSVEEARGGSESTSGSADDGDSDGDSQEEDGSEGRSGGSGGGSRRRRRRGGRGRRGRGRGDEDGTDSDSDGDDDGGEDSSSREDEDGNGTENGDSHGESSGSGSSGSSSSRRRRRRRRSGSGNDEPGTSDDPPNTVVKVREARDEVKAVKGSTRLEAKRQRRREGRDAGRKRNVITEAEFLARRESVKRSMVVRERPGRTQIAVLEDDVLVEHYVAQKSQTSMVGNVYMGKVQNVLPSMEAAFVDIGKGRNAVLYAGEVNWDAVGLEGQPRRIELALKSGDPVLVQVTKDPIGHKGARLTSQISLPGRYVVFVPGGSMTGISRKLPDTERTRLKKIMRQIIPEDAGVIVRTAAEGASEEELTQDVARLRAQWEKITKAQKSKSAPVALSQEPDIAIKVVRDVFNEDFTSLIVEGDKVHQDVHDYVSEVAPDLLERVTKHVPTTPGKDVFAKHRIDEQLLKAMDRKVYLPSGGSLVIDRTEAMTVVDVNTGKFTGSGGSLEETVTKNNIESAEEIVRQLRLRDIGGIIVIDFIDMVLESNRDLVLRRLVECLGRDRTKHQVAEVTSLGLVQMTRKRVGQGLVETFSTPCEHCHGRGLVVDIDGEHHHDGGGGNGGGNGGDESSKSSRRRGRRSRGGAKEENETPENGTEENPDVHRLEDDADSRALARATIASIAAASGSHAQPEVVVDGEVVDVPEADGPATPDQG